MSNKTIPPLDLMFFLTESPESPKHVGAVQVFELPPNAPDNYLRDLVATFKRAPVVSPFNYHPYFPRVGMPQWQVDQDMEMDYHVRHSALPRLPRHRLCLFLPPGPRPNCWIKAGWSG